MWSIKTLLLIALVTVICAKAFERYFRPARDPREPPVLYPNIPIIGHLIGLLVSGNKYYSRTRYVSLT